MAKINDGETGLSARTKINNSIEKTDAITDAGGGVIPSSAQLSKVDSITSVGSGQIITGTERSKLGTIEHSAEVNEELAVLFGTLTSSGTNITLDPRYSSLGSGISAVRSGIGEYQIISSGVFGNGTFVSLTPSQECFYSVVGVDANRIVIQTFDTSGSLSDDLLTNALLKIENYQL